MDDGSPRLELGFDIDAAGAFADLERIDAAIDETTLNAMEEFARAKQASADMLDFQRPTAELANISKSITSFANDASRQMKEYRRDQNAVGNEMDRLIKTMEKETASLGRSREERRSIRIEELEDLSRKFGLTEKAARLLAAETANLERRGRVAQHQAEQERDALAAVNSQLAERARLEMALERFTGLGALTARDRGATFEALAAREAEDEARAIRQAAHAHELFEARVREGTAAMRERERVQKAAINDAENYASRLEAEAAAIGKTTAELRAMEVARQASAADQAGLGDHAERIRAAGTALAAAEQQAAGLAAEERRLAEATRAAADAARDAAQAQAAQDASVHSLRSSVDPLYAAQRRLSDELENAVRLYRIGAIGQEEYARSSAALGSRLDEVQRAQARQAAGMEEGLRRGKLGANDMVNIAFQMQDIFVGLSSGQNPLIVLIQQGSQLGGIMAQTGASVGDMAKAVFGLLVVTTPAAAATAALAAAQTNQAAAQAAAATAGTTAAISAAELAVANEAARAAAVRHAAAEQALVVAQTAVANTAAADTAALAALAVAQTATATTARELAAAQAAASVASTANAQAAEIAAAANAALATSEQAAARATAAAAASATTRLAPWVVALSSVAAVATVAGVAIWRFQKQAEERSGLDAYVKSVGLTKDELKELGDVGVTTGDLIGGLFDTIQDRLNIDIDGKRIIDYLFGPDDARQVAGFIADIYGLFAGGYKAIIEVWGMLPDAMKDLTIRAANVVAEAVEAMVNKSIEGINGLAQRANALIGRDVFGQIGEINIEGMTNTAEGAANRVVDTFIGTIRGERDAAMGAMTDFFSDVSDAAGRRALERTRKAVGDILEDRPEKRDRHAERLAREAEATERQIRNLYLLADAYRASGAEALVAEARLKAESAAIKSRADVEEAVERQVRLAIAQRVSDAAKATANVRDQADAQERVNAMVSAGILPAELAAEMVQDQIADLPLLAALQVAQQRGLTEEAERATKALAEQRAERNRLRLAQQDQAFNAAMDAGADRLAEIREEARLIGETDAVRVRALATLRAEVEARGMFDDPEKRRAYVAQQVLIADADFQRQLRIDAFNASLTHQIDLFDQLARNVDLAARGLADAFGEPGRALGDMTAQLVAFGAEQKRQDDARRLALAEAAQIAKADVRAAREREIEQQFAARSLTAQVGLYGDLADAARGYFKEGTTGYEATTAALKVFRAVEFALSVAAIAQDLKETGVNLANSAARTAASAVEAVVSAIKSLPFPLNLAAGAATVAALASIGVSLGGAFSGSGRKPEAANTGTGSVLGDPEAQSASIKRSIDGLREIDTLSLSVSRDMLSALRSIDNAIGGVAAQIVRGGDINASAGVREGFRPDTTGKLLEGLVTGGGLFSKIPVVGGIVSGIGSLVSSLFGSKTSVVGSGLYGRDQSVGSILSGGFDAATYSDIEKQKRFLGIKTGTSYSTQFGAADPELERQFTLLIGNFAKTITAAAGPLGMTADDVSARLNGITVSLGKLDFKGLSGEQIQERLTAVFGAAADRMAAGVIPGIERFQKVGEGAFETLVRVASTVEAVTATLDQLGGSARTLDIGAKLGLADQFDSIGDLTSAAQSYFERFYTAEEQAAARARQMDGVFKSLGLTTPGTLAAFRALVEAQDLTTEAGRRTYATLLELSPAFADLQSSMEGAKSAADILAERQGLERRLLELAGDTAAIRALDLAKIDVSNRALQEQVWAVEDAAAAAKAADELRKAWTSVGDSIEEEIRRIRGLSDATGGSGFASLMADFNRQTALARGGDQDAAKALPGLSQALLKAAGDAATSRQELNRVQAETAASLEATLAAVSRFMAPPNASQAADRFNEAAAVAPGSSNGLQAANDDMKSELVRMREEIEAMRRENNAGHSATAANTGKTARVLEAVTDESGGNAVSIAAA